MPGPPLRRLLIVASVLALALIPSACGSSSGESQAARDLLEKAFRQKTDSADINLVLQAKLNGAQGIGDTPLRLSLAGPTRSNGRRKLPSLDWKIRGQGAGRSFTAGLVVVPDNVYVTYGGTTYQVGRQVIGRLNRQLRQNRDQNLSLRRLGVDPATWIEDGKVGDGGAVGGDATKRVTGKLNVEKALRDFNKVLRSPRVSGQLPPGAVPSLSDDQIKKVADAVQDPRFEVDVGKADDIVRRLKADVDFKVPKGTRGLLSAIKGGSLSLTLEQTNLDGNQRITPPSGARPLTELLQKLGIPPGLLFGGGQTAPRAQ